ncbi:unnamed protein product, partial [marine sediment metagenome]
MARKSKSGELKTNLIEIPQSMAVRQLADLLH